MVACEKDTGPATKTKRMAMKHGKAISWAELCENTSTPNTINVRTALHLCNYFQDQSQHKEIWKKFKKFCKDAAQIQNLSLGNFVY